MVYFKIINESNELVGFKQKGTLENGDKGWFFKQEDGSYDSFVPYNLNEFANSLNWSVILKLLISYENVKEIIDLGNYKIFINYMRDVEKKK